MGRGDEPGDGVSDPDVPWWQVARELLGEHFSGILVTDRYSAYNWYPVRWRQVCWAHLLRDFEAIRGRGGASEEIGEALLAKAHQMFRWWHRVCEGTLQRSTFRAYMRPLSREVEHLLEAGSRCGVSATEGMCHEILKRREALWTFVQVEGVEPTNNAAERAIRPGVQRRKISFGTQSEEGSRFGNRSGCENITLAILSPHGIPCRHGNPACIITRGVGTDPTRSASLYSDTRSARGDVRGHDAGVARTAAPDLAELLPPTIKRPAPQGAATPSSE
jgi:hypothetical protein